MIVNYCGRKSSLLEVEAVSDIESMTVVELEITKEDMVLKTRKKIEDVEKQRR